jgi:hypothetical protein
MDAEYDRFGIIFVREDGRKEPLASMSGEPPRDKLVTFISLEKVAEQLSASRRYAFANRIFAAEIVRANKEGVYDSVPVKSYDLKWTERTN